MASLIRIGFSRVLNTNTGKLLSTKQVEAIGIRCISGKTIRAQEKSPKPAPWPYNRKGYTILNYFFDKTTARFDENSKILVVEGPVASGKSKFAKELAEELEMLYLPEANLDMTYINSYGYDLRKLDEQMPDSCKSFDINNFLTNPKHKLSAAFQVKQYQVKFSQYIDALAHVLSTGQGVVLDRCCYSDFVFAQAMHDHGYISKGALKFYYDIRKNTIHELLRPHLVIYLDVPVPKVLDNIKKRNLSYEVNSQVMNPNYLTTMESIYKHKYLKEISNHSELLVYDWSDGGDAEVVVEDIERIDFNRYDVQDPHLKDWVYTQEEDWACLRYKYADKKDFLMTYFNVPTYDVPEMLVSAEESRQEAMVLAEAPGQQYDHGYNQTMGDQNLIMKIGRRHRNTLPIRERRSFV